jgi:hypothetical protein
MQPELLNDDVEVLDAVVPSPNLTPPGGQAVTTPDRRVV